MMRRLYPPIIATFAALAVWAFLIFAFYSCTRGGQ